MFLINQRSPAIRKSLRTKIIIFMPVIKYADQRVAVLIDTQNLYHSAKNLYKAKVNFKNVLEDCVAGRTLIRAMAYVITTESGEERSFFDALEKTGIETKTKNLQIFSSGAKKADWDVAIAIDAIRMAPRLDAVIIVSGDGDFVPLVEYLKVTHGLQVEMASFGKSTSSKLIEAVDDFIDLDDNQKRYLLRSGPRKSSADEDGDSENTGADEVIE